MKFFLTVKFRDISGKVVGKVRTHELAADPGTVRGHLVCDGIEEPFEFNLPASDWPEPPDVFLTFTPKNQVVKSYSVMKSRQTGQTADMLTVATRSPVPANLEVHLNGREAFSGRTASWS